MADREETLVASTEAELLLWLAQQRRWLRPVGEHGQLPNGDWFVRVQARTRTAPRVRVQQGAGPAASRGPRGRTIAAVAAVCVALGGVTAGVWWLLDQVARHIGAVVGVLVVVAVAVAAFKRRSRA